MSRERAGQGLSLALMLMACLFSVSLPRADAQQAGQRLAPSLMAPAHQPYTMRALQAGQQALNRRPGGDQALNAQMGASSGQGQRLSPATEQALAARPVLSWADFARRVTERHPLGAVARLAPELGRGRLREARGAFDPRVVGYRSQKVFKDIVYYRNTEVTGTIPLRAGMDLVGGYEQIIGTYTNPESFTPPPGLYFGGVNVSLGRGLFIDSRRAGVLLAQNQLAQAEVDRIIGLNSVLLQAARDYWDWHRAWQQALFLQEGVELALIRYQAVRQQAIIGELAAIDTTEALILYQDRYNQLAAAVMDRQMAFARLETHFWDRDLRAEPLDTTSIPPLMDPPTPLPAVSERVLLDQIADVAPRLRMRRLDLAGLEIERRLAVENLKPVVDVRYQFLSSEGARDRFEQQGLGGYLENNYRFGASVSMPLFLRRERGRLMQVRVRLEQNELALRQAQRMATAEGAQLLVQLRQQREQIAIQEEIIDNNTRLRDGEQIKFELGESSLFLVNVRETRLIDASLRLADLRARYERAQAELLNLLGTLPDAALTGNGF